MALSSDGFGTITSNMAKADVNAAPVPPVTDRLLFVSKSGDDASATGTSTKPYLTISAAMAAIADASPTKRYGIMLNPGVYTEPFALKANVIIKGRNDLLSQIGGTITLDSTWTPAGDHRSGFDSVLFKTVGQTFDLTTVSSNEGKFTFTACTFNNLLTLKAFSNINQADIRACKFLAGYMQTGMVSVINASLFMNGGAITVNGRAGGQTILGLYGGDCDGAVNITHTGTLTYVELGAFSCISGPMSITGGATVVGSPGSFPGTINLASGAVDPRPTVTGSRGANAALTSLLSQLQSAGVILNSTTA